MGIFDKLWSAIRGKATPASSSNAPAASTASPGAPPPPTAGAAAATAAPAVVDVEAIMTDLEAKSGHKSNWRHSIVDLMSLLGMDNSLAERRELAKELGYTGDTKDTATMNIWLHKQVLKQMAANGGKVPANMLD